MTIQTLVVGKMATNCYVVDRIIIDPGDDAEYIISYLKTKPSMIVATHGHFDHIMAAYAIQRAYDIPFYIHEEDIFLLSRMQSSAKHFLGLKDVDPPPIPSKIKDLPFIHTPGHTPGSISLVFDGFLIVGDTVFADGSIGRTDHVYSDPYAFATSVARIRSYSKGTRVLPGHGGEFIL